MKDRLSKISKKATHALCLLAACGLTYSCADEYKLDDEAPTWLGSSIYDYLEKDGHFTNFVRLINDLGYKEDLAATGSRTLFVANDSSFAAFYDRNAKNPNGPWSNATSYDKLSVAQKKLLLKSAMLNNAYLLEMLSRGEGNAARGVSMRKATSVGMFDSLTYLRKEDFPVSASKMDRKYWDALKTRDKDGIYLLSDNSTPMIVYFTDDFMANAGISQEDFEELLGEKHQYGQYFVYQNKVIKGDITCENGYIHQLKDVLLPQSNMADAIRNHGNANIYSHILDRFSAPYYVESLVKSYKEDVDKTFNDSIFVRKYFSEVTNTNGVTEYLDNGKLTKGPDGNDPVMDPNYSVGLLKFDPGWNQYTSSENAYADMGAMFVPNDEALIDYFRNGSGKILIDNFKDPDFVDDGSVEALLHNIDQIPLNVLYSFVSNLMQRSFTESVPSKFGTILDQANDNLFQNVSEAKASVKEKKVTNNGVVYFMDRVYPPVDFSCVAGPAFTGTDYKIMKFAIYSGAGIWPSELMEKKNFFAYLRAKGSSIDFSFFLPSDYALQNYVDPASIIPGKEKFARVLSYNYKNKGANDAPFDCEQYLYDVNTGKKGRKLSSMVGTTEACNRLVDILETHTVVHDLNQETDGILSGKEYYLSKSGSPIHVTREASGSLKIQGGMQMDNESKTPDPEGAIPGFQKAEVTRMYNKEQDKIINGSTYCLNAAIQPAVRSVYNVLSSPSSTFFSMCTPPDTLFFETGLVDETLDVDKLNTELDKYRIFSPVSGGLDQNVTFFASFNYTVYVPSNEALEKEIREKHLPTPESIQQFIDDNKEENGELSEENKKIAKAQLLTMLSFVRAHFQDNSIFAEENADKTFSYNSAAINDAGDSFIKIEGKVQNGKDIVLTSDRYDQDVHVVGDRNITARDYIIMQGSEYFDPSKDIVDFTGTRIVSSAYTVIHNVDGVLRNIEKDEDYTKAWSNPLNVKKTIANFRINKK